MHVAEQFLRSYLSKPLLLYSGLVVALVLSVADLSLGRMGLLPIPATVSALVLLFPLVFGAMFTDLQSRPAFAFTFATLRANISTVAWFTFAVVLSLVYAGHNTAYWQEDGKWIFLLAYNYVVFLFGMILPLIPTVRESFTSIVRFGLIALVASMMYDLSFPGFFSTETSRAAGFPGNSNWSALTAALLCAAALRYRVKNIVDDTIFLLISGIAVFCTLSRSGLLQFFIVCMFYSYYSLLSGGLSLKRMIISVFSLLCFVIIGSTAISYISEHSTMFTESTTRLERLMTGKALDDGSQQERINAAMQTLDYIEESAVFGHGTGFVRRLDRKPHNIYLQQWLNNGIFGLVAYIGVLVSALLLFWKRRYPPGLVFISVSLVAGLFSHNIIDQKPFLLLLGMMLTNSSFLKPSVSSPLYRQPETV